MILATRLSAVAMVFTLCLPLSSRLIADTIQIRVADGIDDAEEHLTDVDPDDAFRIDLTSSDLELGGESSGTDLQEIGIRFRDVGIPAGSIIQSASIQFTVDETDDEDTSLRIFGELNANPAAYTTDAFDITGRDKTVSFVDWSNIPIWDTEGVAGPDQLTPDLASVVQEIVNLGGWAEGDSLAFMFAPNPGGERTAESFDGDAGAAALLTVDFIPEPSTIVLSIGLAGLFAVTVRRRHG